MTVSTHLARRAMLCLLAAAISLLPGESAGQGEEIEEEIGELASEPRLGLGWRVRGGAVHQFNSSLDDGGEFDATRAVFEAGARYAFAEGNSVGVSMGYSFDGYGFSDGVRIDGVAPWDDVHTLRFSAPIFWEPTPDWMLLAIPNLRMAAEEPEDWGDALAGGAILGFSYRFNDRLRLGPGIGITSEIEEDVNVFPVILLEWRVTDRLRFETGEGLGATRGPGLLASYELADDWQVSLGFRRDKQRFRLDDRGGAPGGVGEDTSYPVLAGLTWGPVFARLSLIVGAEFGGELRIEDSRGKRIAKTTYDPAAFLGFTFRLFL